MTIDPRELEVERKLAEYGLRRLDLVEFDDPEAKGNNPGSPPEIIWPAIDKLVINEEYQRNLSKSSTQRIKRIAMNWDWNKFKVLSLAHAEVAGFYEVTDGQHSAIAARLNGHIHTLPGLLGDAATLQHKAQGFLGINKERTNLTPYDIYSASLTAGDEAATNIYLVCQKLGIEVLRTPPVGSYSEGQVLAISSLHAIYKTGGYARLLRILTISRDSKAKPISAILLKALDEMLPLKVEPEVDMRVTYVLKSQGVERMEIMAKAKTPPRKRVCDTLAEAIAEKAGIEMRKVRKNVGSGRWATKGQ